MISDSLTKPENSMNWCDSSGSRSLQYYPHSNDNDEIINDNSKKKNNINADDKRFVKFLIIIIRVWY